MLAAGAAALKRWSGTLCSASRRVNTAATWRAYRRDIEGCKGRIAMKLSRDWFTPLTTGAFVLLAVTGVLLFFHLDMGLNKVAHEWLSWVLLVAAAGHVATNFGALKRHLAGTRGRAIIGAFALLLGLSFVPLGGNAEPPFAGVVHALARAPLPVVAQVAGVSEPVLHKRLLAAGVGVEDSQGSIEAAVGPGLRPQVEALRAAVAAAAPTR